MGHLEKSKKIIKSLRFFVLFGWRHNFFAEYFQVLTCFGIFDLQFVFVHVTTYKLQVNRESWLVTDNSWFLHIQVIIRILNHASSRKTRKFEIIFTLHLYSYLLAYLCKYLGICTYIYPFDYMKYFPYSMTFLHWW